MAIAILGANGQIGRILTRKLSAFGQSVHALIRDDSQQSTIRDLGGIPIQGDLEGEFKHVFDGCDAVIFTAGSGGHTGGDMTLRVDLWGAIRSFEAADEAGIRRYLMVSALKAADPDAGPERLRHYLVAKHIADDYLRRSALDWTIVRPGGLLNEPGTGQVQVAPLLPGQQGSIPREDVADILIACLEAPNTITKSFDVISGNQPIGEALAAL